MSTEWRTLPQLIREAKLPMVAYLFTLDRRARDLGDARPEVVVALVGELLKAREALASIKPPDLIVRELGITLGRYAAAQIDVEGLEEAHGREAVCEAAGVSASHFAAMKGAHEGKGWKIDHLEAFASLDGRFSASLELRRWTAAKAARVSFETVKATLAKAARVSS